MKMNEWVELRRGDPARMIFGLKQGLVIRVYEDFVQEKWFLHCSVDENPLVGG
jgi:hypothetical protein